MKVTITCTNGYEYKATILSDEKWFNHGGRFIRFERELKTTLGDNEIRTMSAVVRPTRFGYAIHSHDKIESIRAA